MLTIDLSALVENPEIRAFYGWDGASRNRIAELRPGDEEQVALLLATRNREDWWPATRVRFRHAQPASSPRPRAQPARHRRGRRGARGVCPGAAQRASEKAFGPTENEQLLRRVLVRGYIDPAASHEAAADELNLSRAAYFRRSKVASERVAEYVSGASG